MKRLLGACLISLALATPLAAVEKKEVEIQSVKKDGKTYFYAHNLDPWMPYHFQMDFDQLVNQNWSARLPIRETLKAGETRMIGWLQVGDPQQGASYRSHYVPGMGDPAAVPDTKAVYLFPFPHGIRHALVQGYFGAQTHQQEQALDFEMPVGSPVSAARDGVVISVETSLEAGGAGPEFATRSNYIRILHADGTWAEYVHLVKHGAKVKVGDKVLAGQLIGLSGNTGQSSGPHLHFAVKKAKWDGEETVPTRFLTQSGKAVELQSHHFYYGFQPGRPPFKELPGAAPDPAGLEATLKPVAHDDTVRSRIEETAYYSLVYFSNGTSSDKIVTLSFTALQNFRASKPTPFSKLVPAGKEAYFLTLEKIDWADKSYFETRYTYR